MVKICIRNRRDKNLNNRINTSYCGESKEGMAQILELHKQNNNQHVIPTIRDQIRIILQHASDPNHGQMNMQTLADYPNGIRRQQSNQPKLLRKEWQGIDTTIPRTIYMQIPMTRDQTPTLSKRTHALADPQNGISR